MGHPSIAFPSDKLQESFVLNASGSIGGSKKRISVFSGWGNKDHASPIGILSNELMSMMKACEHLVGEYELVVRIHPYVSHKLNFSAVRKWLRKKIFLFGELSPLATYS